MPPGREELSSFPRVPKHPVPPTGQRETSHGAQADSHRMDSNLGPPEQRRQEANALPLRHSGPGTSSLDSESDESADRVWVLDGRVTGTAAKSGPCLQAYF